MELVKKYNQYLMVGLQEYWIVDPLNLFISVYTLKGDEYKAKNYDRESKVPVEFLMGKWRLMLLKYYLHLYSRYKIRFRESFFLFHLLELEH